MNMKIHRKNSSALIDRLILAFGFVLLLFATSISNVRAKPFCHGNVDLVFVVDASYSIRDPEFDIVCNFVVQLYSSILENGGNGGNLHAGVVMYASTVYDDDRLIRLSDDSNMLVPRLKNFERDWRNIYTNTYAGLSAMLDMFIADGRPDSTKVGILITDGISDDREKTRQIAETIKADPNDIFMIAIGVGNRETVDLNELRSVASDIAHAIIQADLTVEAFKEELLKKVCAETLDKKADPEVEKESLAMDVVFLLPESVLDADFQISKDFIKTVMQRFEIGSSTARVGIIKYGQTVLGPQHYIQLTQYDTEATFFVALDNMRRNAANERGNAVHLALEELNLWVRRMSGSTRPVAAVLLTPGSASEVELAVQQAELVSKTTSPKVYLNVFGIGTNTDSWESERNRLAYSDATSFYTENFLGIAGTTDPSIQLIEEFRATLSRIGRGTLDSAGPGTIDRYNDAFDVMFAVDGSKMMSSAAFQISLVKFVIKELIDEFELYIAGGAAGDSVGGRVGVMLHDAAGVYNMIPLGDYTSRADLLEKIDELVFIERTDKADNALSLEAMRNHFEAFPREPAAQIGYLITLSESGYPLLARAEAQVLAKAGIQLIVIGVGNAVSQDELNSLQMFEDGNGPVTFSPVFSLTSTETLGQLRADLEKYTAINRPTGNVFRWETDFDLIVGVHAECGRYRQGIDVKYFLQDIFARHDIGPENVRVGVQTFGQAVNTGTNQQIVLGADPYLGSLSVGVFRLNLVPTGGPNIEAAVDGIKEMFEDHGRPGVPKVALIITQGISLPESLNTKISEMKNDGIKFAIIGVGAETQSSFITQVASNSEMAFLQPSWPSIDWTTHMDAGLIALATGQYQPPGQGDILRLPTQCNLPAAIIFVIDASESMSSIFPNVKAFVAALMSGFAIPPLQIGALAFASDVIDESIILPGGTNSYIELYLLFNEKINIAENGLSTRTDLGIQQMTDIFGTVTDFSEKICVLVTDGKSENPDLTQQRGREARLAGINIITIGVGVDATTRTELKGLAENDDQLFSFTGDDFTDPDKLQTVQERICILSRAGECGPGNFRDTEFVCQQCGVGTFQDKKEEQFCYRCPTDYTTITTGSQNEADCTINCPPGTKIDADDCEECPIGQYQDKSAQETCETCPADRNSTPFLGATSLDECTADVCNTDMDLIMIVDGSSNIGLEEFSQMKAFITRQIQKFVIGADRTRVGVVRIGSITTPEDVYSLPQSNSEADVIQAILALQSGASSTNTASAIYMARLEMDKNSRNSFPKVIVMVTHGPSRHPGQTEFQAMVARGKGYVILALGLGSNVNEAELENVAPGNVVIQRDFSSLATFDFSPQICEAARQYQTPLIVQSDECSAKLELIIIMDLSDGINSVILLKASLVQFLDVFPEISDDTVRVGVFAFGSEIHVDKVQILSGVKMEIEESIKVQSKQDGSSTDMAGALRYAKTLLADSRPDVMRVVMIFTDGKATDSTATKSAANMLRDDQIYVLAVSYLNMFPYEKGLEDIGTSGADSVVNIDTFILPAAFTETLGNRICDDKYVCPFPLEIVYIWDLADNSAISDRVPKFTADLSARFSTIKASLIRVGEGGAVSLVKAIEDADTILSESSTRYTVSNIMVITDKSLPADTSSLNTVSTTVRQKGRKITVLNAGPSPKNDWKDIASSPTNVFPSSFLDSLHLAWFLCQEPCSSGNEIKDNGQCGVCDKGFYRDQTESYQCVACEGTTTTTEEGSTSPTDCIISKCEIPMDLVLLIDASDSIGAKNFGILKATLWNFVDKFPVGLGDEQTRIAHVTIGQSVTDASWTQLRASTDAIAVKTRIIRIVGGEIQTDTAGSIEKMAEIMMEEGRVNVPKISVVITDGISVNTFQTKLQSAKAARKGISMISIGVGNKIFLEEIQAIASSQDDVLTFNTFADLFNAETLHVHVCDVAKNYKPPDPEKPEGPLSGDCPTRMDIVFVLDASTAVTSQVFTLMKAFITNLIERLDIGPEKIRVGIISYSNVVHPEVFSLDDSINKLTLRAGISRQRQTGSPGRNTPRALGDMIQLFNSATNVKTDVSRVAVVIKAGQTGSLSDLRSRAREAKNEGIHVISVGFGDQSSAMKNELEIIATEPDSVLHLESFSDLKIDRLISLACADDFECPLPMEIYMIWDLTDIGSIKRAEQFMETLKTEFGETILSSVYIDHVENVAPGAREGLDNLKASQQPHRTRALLIITDKLLTTQTKAQLQDVADEAMAAGVLVIVVDANSNSLDTIASSEKLSFNTDMFDVLPHTALIKHTLCTAPCPSGRAISISPAEIVCDVCPQNTYRDNSVSFDCTSCPLGETTSGTESTSKADCRVGVCATAMDIVYVIDASESISQFEFNALLRAFLTNTLSKYDLGLHRIGLIPFSSDVFLSQIFDLNSSTNKDALFDAVSSLTQEGRGSGTNTARAIDAAVDMLILQGRRDVMQSIVVITDGISDNRYRTLESSKKAGKRFIRVIGLGVGSDVFVPEIETIASRDSFRIINSFSTLAATTDFVEFTCEDSYTCSKEMDILIFEDKSTIDLAFMVKLMTFKNQLSASYTSAIESREYFSQADLELKLDTEALPLFISSTRKTKIFLFIITTDIEQETTKAKINSLKSRGGVVALIKANPALDNKNIATLVSNSNLLFAAPEFNSNPYVRHIERELCIDPCMDGHERLPDGSCQKCQVGYHRRITESTLCIPCPEGKTTLVKGAVDVSLCIPNCVPGTYTQGDTCIDCPIGQYQQDSFQTNCLECPGDLTTVTTKTTSLDGCIVNCGPGTRRSTDGQSCIPCPLNFYQPDSHQTSCIACPVNLKTDSAGSTSLTDCQGDCSLKMDIIFLVDASTSVKLVEYQLIKAFIINTISRFVVSQTDTRFGIITFANDVIPAPQLGLSQSTDRETATRYATILIQGQQPGTNMVAALAAARNMFATQGLLGRPRRVVVITDGIADNTAQAIQEAAILKSEYVHITCVGVGPNAYLPLLENVATNPDEVIFEVNYAALATKNILPNLCGETCPIAMDVYFIKSFVGNSNLRDKVNAFQADMSIKFPVSNVMSVNDMPTLRESLSLLTANIDQNPGDPTFTKSVAIVTNRMNVEDVQMLVDGVKDRGYIVSVIYVSNDKSDSSYDSIVSEKDLLFFAENFDVSPYSEYIFRALCIAPCGVGSERSRDGVCTKCERGAYRSASDYVCVPCPASQTTNNIGAESPTACTDCEPDNWLCNDGQTCIPLDRQCDSNEDCDDGSDEVCNECEAGTFWDGSGCVPCPKGTFQDATSQTSCTLCPAGSSTQGEGTTSTTGCNIICDKDGEELNSAGTGCVPCAKGSYRSAGRHLVCVACPPGFTTVGTGTTVEEDCVPNCDEGEAYIDNQCEDCPPNTIQPDKYQTSCIPCPPGTISPAKSVSCTDPCPAGQQYDYTVSSCVNCPLHMFATAAMTMCQSCPANHVTLRTGGTSRDACLPDCRPGEYWNEALERCTPCNIGEYQADSYMTDCVTCPTGKSTETTGSTALSDCKVPCNLGEEIIVATGRCKPCDIGFYREDRNDISCTRCIEGWTTTSTGSESVDDCIPICPSGSRRIDKNCVPCEIGSYQTESGKDSCVSCPEGRSTLTTGTNRQDLCLDLCESGSEMTNRDPLTCTLCPLNKYRQRNVDNMCVVCEATFITLGIGAERKDECLPNCEAGESWNADTGRCEICVKGTFQSVPYQRNCIRCPEGWTTDGNGKTDFSDCLPDCLAGRRWDVPSLECVDCGVGFFQSSRYQLSCDACPPGTTTQTTTATLESQCQDPCSGGEELPDGRTSSDDCTLCPLNFYKDPSMDTKCQPCPAGFITEATGSSMRSDCKPNCEAGTRYDAGLGRCVDCARGTFQVNRYQTTCTPCQPSGFTTLSPGADSPDLCVSPCTAGFKWSGGSCVPCDVGEYQNLANQINCKSCPDGQTTNGPQSDRLEDCIDTGCLRTQFQCTNGDCIPLTQRCDGTPNCADSSDEGSQCPAECPTGERIVGRDCEQCPVGMYQDMPNKDFCIPCSNGRYTVQSGATSETQCIECAAGWEFTQGQTACSPCPINQFRAAGSPSCMSCPAGFVTLSTGTTSLAGCLPDCPQGSYYAGSGCVQCPIGQYQDESNMRQCKQCPDRRITLQEGSQRVEDCLDCAAGSDFTQGDTTCKTCPINYYKPALGTRCIKCDDGFVTLSSGSTMEADCKPNCAPGYYYTDVTMAICSRCARGQYQPGSVKDKCEVCPPGTTTEEGATTTVDLCIDICPSGTEWDGTTGLCSLCPRGSYKEKGVDTTCQTCENGYTTRSQRATSEQDCVPDCSEGEYWSGTQCDPCPPGTYQDIKYQTSCTSCPEGTFVTGTGAISRFQCQDPCENGEEVLRDNQGSYRCVPCPRGEIKVNPQTVCTPCPAGFTTKQPGSTICVPDCLAGSFWNGQRCELCAKGTYQTDPYQNSCIACTQGLYTRETGTVQASGCLDLCPSGTELQFDGTCMECEKNYYREQFGDMQCIPCPGSSFTLTVGAVSKDECLTGCLKGNFWDGTQCSPCPEGQYQNRDNQQACIPCGDGQTTLDVTQTTMVTGATSQEQCHANCQEGQMVMTGSTSQCVSCPKGTFQNRKYQDTCIPCPAGKTTIDIGRTQSSDCYDPCESGRTYNSDTGECDHCGFNRYRDRTQHDVCQNCQNGQITNTDTASECVDKTCPDGTVFDGLACLPITCALGQFITSNYLCENCPPGTYQNLQSERFCNACPSGTTSSERSTQLSDCRDPCPSGEELPISGLTVGDCVPCPKGSYKRAGETTQCVQCSAGFTTAASGTTRAEDCLRDCKAGSKITTNGCEPCELATFQPEDLKSTCTPCPLGQTTDQTGSDAATDCKDRCNSGFELGADKQSCVVCPKGEYREKGTDPMCMECGPGFTTETIASPDSSNCVRACMRGQGYNAVNGLCEPCAVGTYQAVPYRENCVPCPSWKTTLLPGADRAELCIDPCASGLYRAASGQCLLCPRSTYRVQNVHSECQSCRTSFITLSEGAVSEDQCFPDCPPATHWSESSQSCVTCEPNTFNPLPYQFECQSCPAEYPINEDDFLDCRKECPPGEVWNRLRKACNWCAKGEYKPATGAACIACPGDQTTLLAGTNNIADCIPDCGPGQFWQASTLTCADCGPGSFQTAAQPHGLTACTACPGNNMFQPMSGQTMCLTCTGGMIATLSRASCKGMCNAGQFWSENFGRCEPCPMDTFQPTAGFQEMCQACPTGLHTIGTGSTSNTDCSSNWCPAGQTHTGGTCVPCGIGRYRAAGDGSCNDCPVGTTTFTDTSTSAAQCITCAAGTFVDRATQACVSCPMNTYQAQTTHISITCTSCPSGQTTTGVGSNSPNDCDCPSGLVLNGATCAPCGTGFYRTRGVQTTCQACPTGMTTTTTTAASITECHTGSEGGGWCGGGQEFVNGACCNCRISFYKPADATSPMCLPCPAGLSTMFVGSISLSQCIDTCPDGSQFVRDSGCVQCGIGSFKDRNVGPLCMNCPTGTTTTRAGACSMLECRIPCCNKCLDLVIVVDISSSSHPQDISHIRIFLTQLVNLFRFTTDRARIGIIRYASTSTDVITLQQGTSIAALTAAIDNGITIGFDNMVNTAAALDRAREDIAQSGRPSAAKHVLLITDDMLTNAAEATNQANQIKAMATLSVIGLADSVALATAANNGFLIHDYQTLPFLQDVLPSVC